MVFNNETDLPCPECGKKGLEINTVKAVGEGFFNIIVTADTIKNVLVKNKKESNLRDLIQSVECPNCGNKESHFRKGLIEDGYDALRERENN